jgi:hypothetical protein
MLRRVLAGALALIASAPAVALAHEGNPNFRSDISRTPPGLEAEIVNYDDSIEVVAEAGRQLEFLGYDDEPYLRFLADGTVEVNTRSPAAYLNEDRFADVEVPGQADPDATPRWEQVAEHGRYAWHDHRIHYMGEGTPPQVEDESAETHVFDWKLPVRVDGAPATIAGSLTWVPSGGGISAVLLIGLGGAVLVSLALAILRIRRRERDDHDDGPPSEAW